MNKRNKPNKGDTPGPLMTRGGRFRDAGLGRRPAVLLLLLALGASWCAREAAADIISHTGNLFLGFSTGNVMALNANGLGLGTLSPSANLHVQGNAVMSGSLGIGTTTPRSSLDINGSWGFSIQSVSSNTTLSGNSIVLVDSSSGNLTVTLPTAASVPGRTYTVKKLTNSNTLTVDCLGGNMIDDGYKLALTSSANGFPFAQFVSGSSNWFVLQRSSDGTSTGTMWYPTQLGSALYMWFDADDSSTIALNGSNVSQWNDKSGNARHASQATTTLQPAYTASAINGKPSLTFAPGGAQDAKDKLAVTFSVTQNNLTVFAVARRTAVGNSMHTYARVVVFHIPGVPTERDYNSTNTWIALCMPSYNFGYGNPEILSYRNELAITGQSMAYNTPYIMGSNINGSSVSLRVNGNETTGTTSATAMSSTEMLIGASSLGTDAEMYGDIAEVIVCSSLSTANQQTIEGYLAWKWSLVSSLPSNHPYKNQRP